MVPASSQIDLAVLRADLISRAAEVATTLLGKPNGALSSRRELRFGNRGSLTVATAGEKAGCWYDHENGAGGDLLRLIQRVRGGDFAYRDHRRPEDHRFCANPDHHLVDAPDLHVRIKRE